MALYRELNTSEEINSEYDVEKSVPDFTVYARQYVDGSAQARARLRGHLGVRYGPTTDEYVDIFPARRRRAPVLLFLHGGYWRILSARDFSFVAEGPVAGDMTIVVVNYALCPKVTLDEIVRQTRAAVAWCWDNIAQYGGDPHRMAISGHSAGGHLTAAALLTDWRGDYGLPHDILKGGLSISGLFDLRPLKHSFLQPDLRLDDALIERNSPQFHVRPVRAPLFITYGGDETSEFCRQSDDFLTAWQAAGNRGEMLHQPGRNHFTAITGFADRDSPLCDAAFRLLRHRPFAAGARATHLAS